MANLLLTESDTFQAFLAEADGFMEEVERTPCQIINAQGNVVEGPFINAIEADTFLSFFYPGVLSLELRVVRIED